ncbi:unnamed protein product [Heligmosomoides polygyrus]|uniref:CARMIL pleckstrin homology domain-containing protein n=1 Tax=Heligmosomoides polygyrus TaxID=6339 RepID=A0A3P8CHZ1_HELPZ|nr:unnamed protein product [Heligmosomoides polygyrus]
MNLYPSIIQEEKPSHVLGNKFFDYRVALQSEVSYKGDKFEPRIFVISKFRVFLLNGKSPSSLKIDRSYHILNVKSINIGKDDEVSQLSPSKAYHLTERIVPSMKHSSGPHMRATVELTPESLYDEFFTMNEDVAARACHSFRRTYAALCDFYDQPYREEVSWDVEKIYAVNRLRWLRIDDFSHLLPKDLIPITGVLQYSSYFTGLVADGIRMTSEIIDVIMAVIRKSRDLQTLHLKNCALPRDFITLFASALQQNPSIPLESVDFSKNVLDDKKGFTLLNSVLPRLTTLRQVNFSECGLSEKCTQLFCGGVYSALTAKSSSGTISSLTHINFSTNVLKDDVSSLVNVVSLCTSLRVLDLSDTGFPLDKLWAALKYGGLQIEKLYVGGCHAGKKPADCQVKEFFSMAVNLSHISFANTVLPAEMMKAMLLGLASNQQLKPFHLDISGTCEKGCSAVLEACLGNVQCSSISLRDNNLETEISLQAVLHALGNIKSLRRADLGGANLIALRRSSKQAHAAIINKTILDIVKLFSDDSTLEELILSDARLGPHLSVLLNTLGATTSLRLLDISNNDLGHFGARILCKALQLNVSLRTVIIDSNHLGVEGLFDIATALSMNKTLTAIPYPVQDVCECLARAGCDRSRVLSAMSQMEMYLEKNRTTVLDMYLSFSRGSESINHRPRSIIGDLHSPLGTQVFRDDEPGISLDSPPQLSGLVHLQKTRPKAQRRSGGAGQGESSPFSVLYRDSQEKLSSAPHPSERVGFRAAMLPDAALLSQAVLRSAADRAMSPKPDSPLHNSALSSPGPSSSPRVAAEADSPPPLPHRMNLPAVAPSLPPKPVSRGGSTSTQIAAEIGDDENANNRRSVADMARIFDR